MKFARRPLGVLKDVGELTDPYTSFTRSEVLAPEGVNVVRSPELTPVSKQSAVIAL